MRNTARYDYVQRAGDNISLRKISHISIVNNYNTRRNWQVFYLFAVQFLVCYDQLANVCFSCGYTSMYDFICIV